MSFYEWHIDKYLVENTKNNEAYYVEVTQDNWAENPREYALDEPSGVSFYIPRMPRGYKEINEFADKRSPVYKDYYKTEKCMVSFLEEQKAKGKTILDIYCYCHGGFAFSFDKTGQFNDKFDSWKAGFAILEPGTTIEQAYRELREFESYLTGNIYHVDLYDYKTGEVLDGCGGFYSKNHGAFESDDVIDSLINLGFIENEEKENWLLHSCEQDYDFEKDILERKLQKYEDKYGEME